MTSGRSDLIDIACEVHARTDLAVRIYDGDRHVWLPLSQIELDDSAGSDRATVTLPEWLAHDKGLI